jgi:hypothetical protein
MWDVPAPDANYELRGPDGTAITDSMERRALVQRWSAPWSVAWHVLECFDYDLNGDLAPWTPPSPFASKPHWRFWSSVRAWSRSEIVGYLDYCRQRARDTLAGMTEEKAATPLPASHRYRGEPYAWVITSLEAIPPRTVRRSGSSSPPLASRAVPRARSTAARAPATKSCARRRAANDGFCHPQRCTTCSKPSAPQFEAVDGRLVVDWPFRDRELRAFDGPVPRASPSLVDLGAVCSQ